MTSDAERGGLPLVTFIVPVRDDAVRLSRCLESIGQAEYSGPRRVVVADNGSTDDSAEVARRAGADVLLLPGLSVARLRNAAASQSERGVLAFVDADHAIERGWLAAAVDSLAQPGVGAVGMGYLAPPSATWVQRACDLFRPRPAGVVAVDWLGSGNLAVWKHSFQDVGGFDTSLESCEDVDLCQRLRKAGFGLLSDDRMRSVHFGDPATLRALFFGELWRGRDNMKVTLRGNLSVRALSSLVVPVFSLVCLALFVLGLLTVRRGGALPLLVAVAGLAAVVALRGGRMTRNDPSAGSLTRLPSNLVVAAVYEVARALALVVRATHRTRRERAGDNQS